MIVEFDWEVSQAKEKSSINTKKSILHVYYRPVASDL